MKLSVLLLSSMVLVEKFPIRKFPKKSQVKDQHGEGLLRSVLGYTPVEETELAR